MSEMTPIPMRIVCEGCGELHIDEGEFATKPHHTHSCQHCGMTWRPAVVATVGVRFLPGFRNENATPPAVASSPLEDVMDRIASRLDDVVDELRGMRGMDR